jgi:hypothetical protein
MKNKPVPQNPNNNNNRLGKGQDNFFERPLPNDSYIEAAFADGNPVPSCDHYTDGEPFGAKLVDTAGLLYFKEHRGFVNHSR